MAPSLNSAWQRPHAHDARAQADKAPGETKRVDTQPPPCRRACACAHRRVDTRGYLMRCAWRCAAVDCCTPNRFAYTLLRAATVDECSPLAFVLTMRALPFTTWTATRLDFTAGRKAALRAPSLVGWRVCILILIFVDNAIDASNLCRAPDKHTLGAIYTYAPTGCRSARLQQDGCWAKSDQTKAHPP